MVRSIAWNLHAFLRSIHRFSLVPKPSLLQCPAETIQILHPEASTVLWRADQTFTHICFLFTTPKEAPPNLIDLFEDPFGRSVTLDVFVRDRLRGQCSTPIRCGIHIIYIIIKPFLITRD
ncbi:hypothetical protein VPH35_069684 [Triticum aestivum]